MKTLIKTVRSIHENMTTPAEIWIEDGRIKAIGTGFSEAEFDEVFDAKGQLITPGLVDVHVHLRARIYIQGDDRSWDSLSCSWRFHYCMRDAEFKSCT